MRRPGDDDVQDYCSFGKYTGSKYTGGIYPGVYPGPVLPEVGREINAPLVASGQDIRSTDGERGHFIRESKIPAQLCPALAIVGRKKDAAVCAREETPAAGGEGVYGCVFSDAAEFRPALSLVGRNQESIIYSRKNFR